MKDTLPDLVWLVVDRHNKLLAGFNNIDDAGDYVNASANPTLAVINRRDYTGQPVTR